MYDWLEFEDRLDRTKYLILGYQHVFLDIGENSGPNVVTLRAKPFSSSFELSSTLNTWSYVMHHLLKLLRINLRNSKNWSQYISSCLLPNNDQNIWKQQNFIFVRIFTWPQVAMLHDWSSNIDMDVKCLILDRAMFSRNGKVWDLDSDSCETLVTEFESYSTPSAFIYALFALLLLWMHLFSKKS